jgi:hypothetical protein
MRNLTSFDRKEDFMSKDEEELLESYRKMTPENKAHLLNLAHNTRATQEATKKEMQEEENRKTA